MVTSFINDGIDVAEKDILKLNEDYFLTKSLISLVAGTADYSLPSTIYAEKIRDIIYANGNDIYSVKRLRDDSDTSIFERIAFINQFTNLENYQYVPRNDSAAAGVVLQLVPPARETLASVLTVWFLRNANRLSADADLCDIPEWAPFVVQYAKAKCINVAMRGSSIAKDEMEMAMALRKDMIEALTNRIPDNNDKIPLDDSNYREHS